MRFCPKWNQTAESKQRMNNISVKQKNISDLFLNFFALADKGKYRNTINYSVVKYRTEKSTKNI